VPHIPLIEDLMKGVVPAGSPLLVEYDPASQWYNASLTIAAGWIQTGGRVAYNVSTRPPDSIRSQLSNFELNIDELERTEKLEMHDWYTLTLGQKPKETDWIPSSLKAADLSPQIFGTKPLTSEEIRAQGFGPDLLIIWDDASFLERFNDTKSWIELLITRYMARTQPTKSSLVFGVAKGIHPEWAYKRLETASEGIIDIKVDETGEELRSLVRIRSMRSVGFDARWHRLKIGENFEVTLEK
jgi:KaiC/GvpD/RAD55 family RecA-like ATPase